MLPSLCLLGALFFWPLPPSASEPEPLKIMSYNVLCGFHHGDKEIETATWLAKQQPDVLALQELCGLTPKKLASLAKTWGHEFSVLQKTTGYPVGLTSNSPIEVCEKFIHDQGHGFLHARTQGLDLFVIHLHPGNAMKRRAEIARILSRIQATEAALPSEKTILLGDFNTHSARDEGVLSQQTRLLERRASGGANLVDGQFDYLVIERVEERGLIDIEAKLRPNLLPYAGTFPSRTLKHVQEPVDQKAFLERIDFIFLSPDLAKSCTGSSIHTDKLLNTTSDHYPVSVRIQLNGEQ